MSDVVCPNCHSVTPPYLRCMACNSFLGGLLDDAFPGTRAETRLRLADRVARMWWEAKRSLGIPGRGTSVSRLDAHLRRACRRAEKHNIYKLPTASSGAGEVALIAKVTNLEKFKKTVSRMITTIECPARDRSGEVLTLVTARTRANERGIERLRQEPFVKSLKVARRIRPFLDETTHDSPCLTSVSSREPGPGGEGVIIGIVDFGLDFAHRNFRFANGSTRILALWDQKAPASPDHTPTPYGYGRLYGPDEINAALATGEGHLTRAGAASDAGMQLAYETLGYDVPKGLLFNTGAHGTYVADIAAGNGLGSSAPGVAPNADIVFVDVATGGAPLIAQGGREPIGDSFGDSVQLLEAVDFIFEFAKKRNQACVVNISLGTNGGPHDGTAPIEEAIDWLVSAEPNRAVVIAAGNSFGQAMHVSGQVPAAGAVDIRWRIPRFDISANEVEIWYDGNDRLTLELRDPGGKLVARVRPDAAWDGRDWEKGRRKGLITVINRTCDPNNGDNTINIFFDRGVRAGEWTLRLLGDSVQEKGNFHAWIERDEAGQSRFIRSKRKSYQISNQCTLSSIACGRKSIVVASYDAHDPDRQLAETSSSGPTRDKLPKSTTKRGNERTDSELQPTVSAPGEEVLAAQPRTLVLRQRQSGTSIAAAAVSGLVALILSEAQRRDIQLSSDEIKQLLKRTDNAKWDPGYGYGRVCVDAALAELSKLQVLQSGQKSVPSEALAANGTRVADQPADKGPRIASPLSVKAPTS